LGGSSKSGLWAEGVEGGALFTFKTIRAMAMKIEGQIIRLKLHDSIEVSGVGK